jgi:hypothetical protein
MPEPSDVLLSVTHRSGAVALLLCTTTQLPTFGLLALQMECVVVVSFGQNELTFADQCSVCLSSELTEVVIQ